jgi:hypothetical protein
MPVGLVMVIMAIAGPATAKQDKTWVCHQTHSDKNPVVLVHVARGWGNGHGDEVSPKHSSKHQDEDSVYTPGDEPTKAGPVDEAACDNEPEEHPED